MVNLALRFTVFVNPDFVELDSLGNFSWSGAVWWIWSWWSCPKQTLKCLKYILNSIYTVSSLPKCLAQKYFLNWCEMWLRYSELYENIKGSSFDFCMLPFHANHDHCFLYDLLSQISGLVNCFYVYLLIFMRHVLSQERLLRVWDQLAQGGKLESISDFLLWFDEYHYDYRLGFINLLCIWYFFTLISFYKNYSIQALASVFRI